MTSKKNTCVVWDKFHPNAKEIRYLFHFSRSPKLIVAQITNFYHFVVDFRFISFQRYYLILIFICSWLQEWILPENHAVPSFCFCFGKIILSIPRGLDRKINFLHDCNDISPGGKSHSFSSFWCSFELNFPSFFVRFDLEVFFHDCQNGFREKIADCYSFPIAPREI